MASWKVPRTNHGGSEHFPWHFIAGKIMELNGGTVHCNCHVSAEGYTPYWASTWKLGHQRFFSSVRFLGGFMPEISNSWINIQVLDGFRPFSTALSVWTCLKWLKQETLQNPQASFLKTGKPSASWFSGVNYNWINRMIVFYDLHTMVFWRVINGSMMTHSQTDLLLKKCSFMMGMVG